MKTNNYFLSPHFKVTAQQIRQRFLSHSHPVDGAATWQGVYVKDKPDMVTHELMNVTIDVPINTSKLEFLAKDIGPNLPWADKHFEERVCGEPINPGTEWANWPWGGNAAKFRDDRGMFNHNYMERYWPRFAGNYGATKTADQCMLQDDYPGNPLKGIRYEYGDLNSIVDLLIADPFTRQAYLPIFFPEDTGLGPDNGRKPCTLGYHFMRRGDQLHVYYPMRSCDFVRHWADDVYLTIRLLLWILDKLKGDGTVNTGWENVSPGQFTMHCVSLHVFANDMVKFKAEIYQ